MNVFNTVFDVEYEYSAHFSLTFIVFTKKDFNSKIFK